MTRTSRFLQHLRSRAAYWYELLLYALLLSLLFSVAMAASPGSADDVQCGNIQSSAAVIIR